MITPDGRETVDAPFDAAPGSGRIIEATNTNQAIMRAACEAMMDKPDGSVSQVVDADGCVLCLIRRNRRTPSGFDVKPLHTIRDQMVAAGVIGSPGFDSQPNSRAANRRRAKELAKLERMKERTGAK